MARSMVKEFGLPEGGELYYSYKIGATIGEGTYAKVKNAYSDKLHKTVAVKIINARSISEVCRETFLPRELDCLKSVKHKNIISLYEVIQLNENIYIVMELAENGDLLQHIKRHGAIPEDECRAMFRQLVDAISYLHGVKICHRSLSCENVLLDKQFNIKVADFSLARRFEASELSKTFCGCVAYVSPEILQGKPYHVHLSDVWALGVIFYIMICAEMPFDNDNLKKAIKDQLEKTVSFPQPKQVSEEANNLLQRIMEVDVGKRYTLAQISAHPWMNKTFSSIMTSCFSFVCK